MTHHLSLVYKDANQERYKVGTYFCQLQREENFNNIINNRGIKFLSKIWVSESVLFEIFDRKKGKGKSGDKVA